MSAKVKSCTSPMLRSSTRRTPTIGSPRRRPWRRASAAAAEGSELPKHAVPDSSGASSGRKLPYAFTLGSRPSSPKGSTREPQMFSSTQSDASCSTSPKKRGRQASVRPRSPGDTTRLTSKSSPSLPSSLHRNRTGLLRTGAANGAPDRALAKASASAAANARGAAKTEPEPEVAPQSGVITASMRATAAAICVSSWGDRNCRSPATLRRFTSSAYLAMPGASRSA
mmetsp:Transcript_65356/g.142441  ORF Transcript_65356/g.142441 Transcript_65356/m.142441 type:complete len:226 (+) Transcript_65356:284-961(+)